jgi:alkylation response protein AidB-like acyl-CoA dehydrogenase
MFFALTDDQKALGTAVRELVAGRFGPDYVRASFDAAVGDAPPPGHDGVLWSTVAEQGWLAVTVPEGYDGLGLGLVDAVVVATELGAATLPGPWRDTVLVAEALRLGGTQAQRTRWLGPIAAGEVVAALCLDSQQVQSREDGTLSGVLQRVEYADSADVLLCVGDDDLLRLVQPGPGVRTDRVRNLDGTTALHTVTLTQAPAEVLGSADPTVVAAVRDRAAVLVAADLVGAARRWLERTVDYDRTREQFGRPVGSFQAIKHHLADLHTATTMAGYAVLAAAHLMDVADSAQHGVQGGPDTCAGAAALAVSVAKAKASDTALAVTGAAIQYHGGIGYTWEHDAHFAYKRVRRLAWAYGSAEQHRERIAQLALDTLDTLDTGTTGTADAGGAG